LQEISDMLANNLTLDEEDAVQEELKQLQAEIVRGPRRRGIHARLLSKHTGSRNREGRGTTVRPSNGTDEIRGGTRRYIHAPPLRASIALTLLAEPVLERQKHASKVAVPA
jgi:hypothetical protein